jgi:maleamate amidohydrolase
VLVIDFVNAYVDPNSPLYAPAVVDAVHETSHLLADARARRVPVIYTRVQYHPGGRDGGLFVQKLPVLRRMLANAEAAAIVASLEPAVDDLVIDKQYASAFFGTPLAAILTAARIDTVLITGCSTSGCVRATALDAMQHGFVPAVIRDCVGDRHAGPHEANLFDIQAKYGEVISRCEATDYLATL